MLKFDKQFTYMTTAAIKKQIHKAIDSIESQPILEAIRLILDEEIKHAKNKSGRFSHEEFYERNAKSQNEIKQGKLIGHKTIKSKFTVK